MDQAAHRQIAIDLFNDVWVLLDKPDRTPQEDLRMLHAAHASRHHWGEAGEPVNLARGEWQCSRVYAGLGRGEPAVFHAERCLEVCQANGIGDFDLAYAYEALARAHGVAGDTGAATRWAGLARRAAEAISGGEDRAQFENDLATLPVGSSE